MSTMLTNDQKDQFPCGTQVNVEPKEGDLFHEFTGYVVDITPSYFVVEDQDGDKWDVEFDQISFSSDNIMHED